MRTGAAADHQGYYHEAVFYGSDEELLAVVVPFLREGLAAGEPTIVSLEPDKADLLRSAIPAASGIAFLTGGSVYARPAVAIRSYRELLTAHVAAGAEQIRIVGEIPPAGLGATWDWWARYEAAVNHAYAEFPLWTMCAYDTRVAPAHVLDDVARTHPKLAGLDGRHDVSARFADPRSFLLEPRATTDDPIQYTPPIVDLVDPTPVAARRAVAETVRKADDVQLPAADLDDLVLAVTEAVTNALCHGRPPVRVRCWTGTDRVVVTVADRGPGPSDPFAGLLPVSGSATGGLGMWMTHQLCNHVVLDRGPDGFTIRLTAGNP